MIKSSMGEVHIEGRPVILCAELAALVDGLHQVFSEKIGAERSKKLIMDAVNTGFEDTESIKAENKEAKENIADLLCELADVLRGKEDKEDGIEQ